MDNEKAIEKPGNNASFVRMSGSAPNLKSIEKRRCRAKLFKSGNSLAVRIPAGTRLLPGMEMDMVIEDGQFVLLEPVDQPKRKFNIAKVAGSATGLDYIKPEDRIFKERFLLTDQLQDRGAGANEA
jgi:antitoxin VapB